MLAISKFLEKYRSVVLIFLFLPLLGLFLSKEFHLEMVPPNPHITFDISFKVPTRTNREITEKVIQPSEKVFNGLPGLIGVQSTIKNETGTIRLRFKEDFTRNSIYLNIQEKMDRIKLMIPRDVESFSIDQVIDERPADFMLTFNEPIANSEARRLLSSHFSTITQFHPNIDDQNKIVVKPDPVKLAKNGLSISDVTKALQSLGLSTSIGRQNGVMFETGNTFINIEDLKSALISARDDRPISLSNVAEVEIQSTPPLKELSLWIDKQRTTKEEFKNFLSGVFSTASISQPGRKAILEQSLQPVLLILLTFLLQFVVVKILRLPLRAMLFFAAMGATIAIHFLFWKGLIFPPLTVLDLHALALTLFIGSIFLAVLYIRIRSYFLPEDIISKPPKSLDQVKLFSLAELMPTYIILAVVLWIASLPFLSTTVNLPSRYISNSLFHVGFPILFTILVVFPLLSSSDFLSKNIKLPKTPMKWFITPAIAKYAMWLLLGFTVASIFIFKNFNFGVNKIAKEDSSYSLVYKLRGYQDRLVYRTTELQPYQLTEAGFEYYEKQTYLPSKVYNFSPSGMRFIGELDLPGFTDAVKNLQKGNHFGFLKNNVQKVPLHFSSALISNLDIPSLLLSDNSSKKIPKAIHTLVDINVELLPHTSYRDNLENGDRIVMLKDLSRGTFKTKDYENILPTPWTAYLLDQFKAFQNFHIISLIFIFFAFAIYMNSFIRSSLVLIFAIGSAGFVFLFRTIFPWAFHADCLWLLYLPTFIGLFQILVQTRIIDIERTRGYDRDACINEVKKEFAPSVYLCSWTIAASLLIAGLIELVPGAPTLGFWREGVFIALSTAIILYVSTHILFPLFYLTSEEVVNSIAMRAYKILVLKRVKKNKVK